MTALVIGGEHWSKELIKNWKGVCDIYNAYGPSEVSVITTIGKVAIDKPLDIGRPIFNTQCFVLNEYLDLQLVGAIGELYIGGESVGRGYLNNKELTHKSFMESPKDNVSRLYKTGDLVRWNYQGNLEFVGRLDNQVKVRGYRIETGEIKTNIEKCTGVRLAHILVEKNQFQVNEIVAFIETSEKIDSTYIEGTISDFIPSYMLPSRYIFMEQLPMTINGKVDEKKLKKAEMFTVFEENIVLPENETEKEIAKIWKELLGLKNDISVKENFFRLGGHSLTIARLLGELKKQFNIQAELKSLYLNPTIEKQAKLISNSEKEVFEHIKPVASNTNYVLSSSQKRLWVLCRFPNLNRAYNISNTKIVSGKLNVNTLEDAFISIINRHESLRTNFREDHNGTVYQIIRNKNIVPFTVEQHNTRDKKKDVTEILNDFTQKIFDLSSELLIRAQLIKIKEEEYILHYVVHHIVADGWSIDILENELKKCYNAISNNENSNLPSLNIHYKDYANWQQNTLNNSQGIAARNYWKAQFNDTLPVLDLPTDFIRPKVKTYQGRSEVFEIKADLLSWLNPILKQEEATVFMGLTALLNLFLYKYSGQTDIVLGVPVAGRDHVDLNNQIGFYVNTIALRTQFEEQNSFIDLLTTVKQNMLASYAHQMYPIDELFDHINIERDISRNALFDVMIAFQDLDEDKKDSLNFYGTKAAPYQGEKREYSLLDLTFSFVKRNDDFELEIEYDTDLFRGETIARMVANFFYLLNSINGRVNVAVNELEMVNEKEKHILLHEFNQPVISKKYASIKDLFEATTEQFPDRVAVLHDTKEINYSELNEKANQFADYLKSNHQLKKDDLLVIYMQKTEKLLISVLAAAKLGIAYVPADINAPKSRLDYIIQDTNARFLIDEQLYDSFAQDKNQYSRGNFKNNVKEQMPFTVIYTSGTTGKPKGSVISNKNVASRIQTEIKILNKKGKIITVNTTNAAFDVCLLEFFLPLLTGGSVLIPTQEQNDSHSNLVKAIKKHKVNVLQGTPSFVQLLFQEESVAKALKGITHICIGGESLNSSLVQRIKQILPNIKVNNHFGPTETTIDAIVNRDLSSFEQNIIGKPIAQTQVFIVNSKEVLVPLGATGEICIGGEGVTMGYLNNKALTDNRFIDSPWSEEKIYKTGDLGRWLPDGNIEFIGRKDSQIKIRGYRVELEEIEHTLIEHENISEAALIVKENELKNKELIAFVVLNKKMKSHEIKRHLKNKLAFYMIPNHIIEVPSISLTINGKKDYKLLENKLTEKGTHFMEEELRVPNKIDKQLLSLWEELLRIDKITLDDNFFSLGGNSIMIIEINNRLRKIFDTNFDISIFYEYTSILDLSDFITSKLDVKIDGSKQEESEGEIEILNF
ncbi:amino acid adenylation domain-containing protein [Tenacibaculum tangerinum]|uniref:Amino acid adenylation domain-containing protein n=1 Tax=Tenacibaculum tangerinum TaxID=3038772 RepID=A0ABY8L6R4_9FLAO|nr:amino acid adenylation domain-containing protein [Tenacibaculum tangerinum]